MKEIISIIAPYVVGIILGMNTFYRYKETTKDMINYVALPIIILHLLILWEVI